MEHRAVIVLRASGQVINHATVLDPSFQIETGDLGTLTFKTADLKTIVYKNLPSYQRDMLRTNGGSEFNGTIVNDPIAIEAADLGGRTSIAKAKIISIVW